MRKGVPAELRKRALQRLWRSNPTLANLDGLLEYGEDYTKIGTAKQVVRTAYQVGRGMLGRIEAQAATAAPALPGRAGSAPAEPLPTASLPAPAGPDADQPAGEAAGEARALTADRQEEAPRPAGETRRASVRPSGPRPLPGAADGPSAVSSRSDCQSADDPRPENCRVPTGLHHRRGRSSVSN